MGTPFQEQGPNPLAAGKGITCRQGLPLRPGSPWHAQCPAIVLLWPLLPAAAHVLLSWTPPALGSAPSRMVTTCFVRCPACPRNGTMKTLSFPSPWGFCCWILNPCLQPASQGDPASFQLQPELLCSPVCLLRYCIFPPCTDKEAISSLSFILRVKLLTRTDWFVQGDDLQLEISLVPSVLMYQKK